MAIIELCRAHEDGAKGHHDKAGSNPRYIDADGALGYGRREGAEEVVFQGPYAYWTRLTHVGLCLRDYERNMYDDSDFLMVVWNPEKGAPETIMFATTRGWSYPCYGSWADATDEVKAAYAAYLAAEEAKRLQQARAAKAADLLALRAKARAAAEVAGAPYAEVLRLRHALPPAQFEAVLALFGPRIKSGFKLSLRAQVAGWLKAKQRRHATPLSAKQMAYLV